MYKKQFTVQQQNLLSKKDVKALRAQLLEQFPAVDNKLADELLPEGQVKLLKLDNRNHLYTVGEAPPCFFDVEGRGDLYPTLNMLWQHPYIMSELTIHPPVSKFVLNGADLMLPGVIVPANGVAGFGVVTKGQKRCIKVDGNPYPIAVGKMLVNQTQFEKLKGKGLEVCHVYKDALWAFSGRAVPNAGFTEIEDEVAACADASWKPGASPAAAPAAAPAEADASPAASAGGEAAAAPEADSAPAAGAGAARAPADWSQDELLEFCFMQAFKVSLTDDKALPVEASELYEKHMKPSRPEGTTLDVKKSSHKQIGKFLNVMRKAKVIDVNEKKGVISVTKVDRGHKKFTEMGDKFADEAAEAAASGAAPAAGAAAADAGLPPPQITTQWKPSHYLESLFTTMGKSKSGLYAWEECQDVLISYIEREDLGKKGDEIVKLNESLITALLKAAGGQKKDATFPDEMELAELEEKMQERMQEHTTIEVAGVGAISRKGPALKVEVSLSRKGAHNVTRVCNLEAYGIDPTPLGDELKRKLNCTVTIEDMPGKNVKDKMLQLQGHVDQDLADYLQKRYGITKSFMSVK